jgi:putative transposase
MEGIAWRWQSTDGAMFKAAPALEAVGANPADRGKKGSKCHLLLDGRGVPLSFIVTGANVNDLTKFDDVLVAIVVKRPRPAKHLCADTGYRSRATGELIESHGYIAHVVDRRAILRALLQRILSVQSLPNFALAAAMQPVLASPDMPSHFSVATL